MRCKYKKQVITLDECKNCSDFIVKRNKPIKKVSKKRIFVKKEIYDKVYDRDKGKCRLSDSNCDGELALHHIIYRSENKKLINEPDNCIMLCNIHHKMVHNNKHLWQPVLKGLINNEQKEM